MKWVVVNALSRDVEREQLNKILDDIRSTTNSLAVKDNDNSTTGLTEADVKAIIKPLIPTIPSFATTVTLTGDVTGSGTRDANGQIDIPTALPADLLRLPDDFSPYWINGRQWERIPDVVYNMQYLDVEGILTLDGDGAWNSVSIEGTEDQIDVVNGNGLDGNPTISISDLADTGVGSTPIKIYTRDSKGRIEGQQDATTDDLPEGAANLYFTDERAQNAVVVQTIDAGDANHSPSADALNAALARKQDEDADLTAIAELTGTSGLLKKTALNTWTLDTTAYTTNTGTVTSVDWSLPSIFSTSGSPITTSGTLTATLASQTANYVLAAPNGSDGAPAFRALVAADIPILNQNTTGSAATLTTGRTIGMTGDVTWTSGSFDGSANVTGIATLANSGVTAGTYGDSSLSAGTAPAVPYLTVNAKGQLTAAGSNTLGTAASYAVGTSGANIPLLSTANTWTLSQKFTVPPVSSGNAYYGGGANVAISPSATTGAAGTVYLRPNGGGSVVGQFMVTTTKATFNGTTSDMSINVTCTTGQPQYRLNSTVRNAMIQVDSSGRFGLFDNTANAWTCLSEVSNAQFRVNSDLTPLTTNVNSLGSASYLWTQVYATNTTISSSDERLKEGIRDISDAEIAAFTAIARLPMVWKWIAKVKEDADSARLHAGPTVQAAIAVMEANGLEWSDYSAFCYDKWDAKEAVIHTWDATPEQAAVYDDDGNLESDYIPASPAGSEIISPAIAAGDRYGFRKEELLCWIVRAQAAKYDALEQRITALEQSKGN